VTLSVVLITHNEEANLPRTLASVKPLVDELGGEIIVVDSGSTDRTREIAESFGARVFVEEWKGFAAQKNSAIDKAQGDWVLLLDADEEVTTELASELKWLSHAIDRWQEEDMLVADDQDGKKIRERGLRYGLDELNEPTGLAGFYLPRRNLFLGKWMQHGGFYPDRKLRFFERTAVRIHKRLVHEDPRPTNARASVGTLRGALIHHAYPTLDIYLEHMRRYAALGAQMIAHKPRWWLWLNRWFNPPLTFFYNYFVRLGVLDGREGLLLHWHHARYVSWKYANALALKSQQKSS